MPSGPVLHVSVFQSACAGDASVELLAALAAALDEPAAHGTQLLLCPELFLGGYRAGPRSAAIAERRDGPFAQAVADLARRRRVAIAYGYPEHAPEGIYNAAMVIGAGGELLAHHRKQVLPNDYERRWFITGAGYTLFQLAGCRIGLLICYEAEFPEATRALAARGADAVLVATALSREWPVVSRAVIPARAFENGVFVAYANHSGSHDGYDFIGESCIVGPDGEVLARAGEGQEVIGACIAGEAVAKARARIPYLADRAQLDSRT